MYNKVSPLNLICFFPQLYIWSELLAKHVAEREAVAITRWLLHILLLCTEKANKYCMAFFQRAIRLLPLAHKCLNEHKVQR